MNKNVIIVGGGTAGWLSALFLKKVLPECNITVIASQEIGILGAGEGSVPALPGFLTNLDINPNELILHCGATIKSGIKFSNWLNDGTSFNHTFQFINADQHFKGLNFHEVAMMSERYQLKDFQYQNYDITDALINSNKVTISDKTKSIDGRYQKFHFSFHFDANKLAEFLKSVALNRGINYYDDIVDNVILNETGSITSIVCKQSRFECDLVIDCTGFRRMILGKVYDPEWMNVSDRLPVNKAIPFFLSPDKQLESCTTATAMDYGWSWKIPLQHRSGCGYVFSSNFCEEQKAIDEVIDKFGNVEIPKCFNFESGYFKNPWIKNCIALGLSGGFLEPLEATSIWTTLHSLHYLRDEIDNIFDCNQIAINNVNRKISSMYESNIDFIQLHYLSKRSDTQFWEYMNNDAPRSERLKHFIDVLNYRPLNEEEVASTYYSGSWFTFAKELKLLDKNSYDKRIERLIRRHDNFLNERKKFINIFKYELAHCPTQIDFINKVKQRAEQKSSVMLYK